LPGHGLFFGLLSDREIKTAAPAETQQVVNVMRNKNILISKIGQQDNVLKMWPAMLLSKENADQLTVLVFGKCTW